MAKTMVKNNLSADLIKKIEGLLTEEKQKLETKLQGMSKEGSAVMGDKVAFPNYGDSEDDNVREVADYEANASIEEDTEKQLRDVKSALKRIAEGKYGVCKYCKKIIEEKRLLARPTSSACVECKKAIVQEA